VKPSTVCYQRGPHLNEGDFQGKTQKLRFESLVWGKFVSISEKWGKGSAAIFDEGDLHSQGDFQVLEFKSFAFLEWFGTQRAAYLDYLDKSDLRSQGGLKYWGSWYLRFWNVSNAKGC
jgi:hypothetical protein